MLAGVEALGDGLLARARELPLVLLAHLLHRGAPKQMELVGVDVWLCAHTSDWDRVILAVT